MRFGFLLLVVLMLCLPSKGWAQSANNKAAAEALFKAGKALLEKGKFLEAAKKFQASQRLDAGIGTLLFMADAFEKAGKLASAWANFREAQAVAQQAGQAQRQELAKERADKLEGKLGRLTVVVGDNSKIEGLKVQRGEVPVARAVWGTAVPVDAGTYKVTLAAPGYKSWTAQITVVDGRDQSVMAVSSLVKIPATAAPTETPAGPSPAEPAPATAPDGADAATDDSGSGVYTGVGIGLTALGAAGVGLGVFFMVDATSKKKDADAVCNDEFCTTAEGAQLTQDAAISGNVATIGFAVGGAALAAGVLTFILAPSGGEESEESDTAGGLTFAPVVSEQYSGVMLGGTW